MKSSIPLSESKRVFFSTTERFDIVSLNNISIEFDMSAISTRRLLKKSLYFAKLDSILPDSSLYSNTVLKI